MKKISTKLFMIFTLVTICFMAAQTILSLIFLEKHYEIIRPESVHVIEAQPRKMGVTQRFVYMAGGPVLLIGFVATYFISKSMTRPINEINSMAQAVADLDFSKKLDISSEDEFGQLADSINHMSETLESTINSLSEANELLKDDIQRREQIDEMRKEFIANVSHELKTPLAIIGGYSEGLKENVNEAGRDEYCDVIIAEVERMNRLVYQLLDLSQLESGVSLINKTRLDIYKIVNDFVERYAMLTNEKGISVGVIKETEDTVIFADEIRCEMVITNFISNAITYLTEPKMIKITLKEVAGNFRFCVFNPCDPMDAEEIEKIWQSFYKGDKSHRRADSGSGLGLHIVKIIMSAHGTECGVIPHEDGVEFWAEFELFGTNIEEEMV